MHDNRVRSSKTSTSFTSTVLFYWNWSWMRQNICTVFLPPVSQDHSCKLKLTQVVLSSCCLFFPHMCLMPCSVMIWCHVVSLFVFTVLVQLMNAIWADGHLSHHILRKRKVKLKVTAPYCQWTAGSLNSQSHIIFVWKQGGETDFISPSCLAKSLGYVWR